MAPKRRREVEDPNNTWNQQLMAACLRFDRAAVEELIDKGADPRDARELAPFSGGLLRLSPLAAILLQGDFSPAARDVIAVLLRHGASVNDLVTLPIAASSGSSSGGGLGLVNADGTVEGEGEESGTERRVGSGFAAHAAARKSVLVAARPSLSPPPDAAQTSSPSPSAAAAAVAGEEKGSALAGAATQPRRAALDEGTPLHYVVALGDHTHLLQLLTIIGEPREALPHTLLYDVKKSVSATAAAMGVGNASTTTAGAAVGGAGGNGVSDADKSSVGSRRGGRKANGPGADAGNASQQQQPGSVGSSRAGTARGRSPEAKGLGGRESVTSSTAASVTNPRNTAPFALPLLSQLPSVSDARLSTKLPVGEEGEDAGGTNAASATTTSAAVAAAAAASTSTSTSLGGGASGAITFPPPASASTSALVAGPTDRVTHHHQSDKGNNAEERAKKGGKGGKSETDSAGAGGGGGGGGDGDAVAALSDEDVRWDFNVRTTHRRLTALELALEKRDVLAVRLLLYFGASAAHFFSRPVHAGMHTALARACAQGDLSLVEHLLDAGDSVTQISADGRYTLVHYAAGHPTMLRYLVHQRGLCIDAENAFGESAVVSLVRHGTGRNASYAAKEAPCLRDSERLAALPLCVLRNYILTPLPPLSMAGAGPGGGGGGKSKSIAPGVGGGGGGRAAGGKKDAAAREAAAGVAQEELLYGDGIGGSETGTWWAFTPLPTADLLQHLFECGANVNHVSGGVYGVMSASARKAATAVVGSAEDNDDVDGEEYSSHGVTTTRASPTSRFAHLRRKNGGGGGGGGEEEPGGDRRFKSSPLQLSGRANGRSPSPHTPPPQHMEHEGEQNDDSTAFLKPADSNSPSNGSQKGGDHGNGGGDDDDGVSVPIKPGEDGSDAAVFVVPRDVLRQTPLMHAILGYHPELIRKLVVDYRASVMQTDAQGACALHYAALCSERSVMDLFLSPLVVPNCPDFDINAVDLAGRTPLHYAAQHGTVAVVEALLALGPTLYAGKPDYAGLTPLHVAVQANETRVVELLVRHSDSLFGAASSVATSMHTNASSSSRRGKASQGLSSSRLGGSTGVRGGLNSASGSVLGGGRLGHGRSASIRGASLGSSMAGMEQVMVDVEAEDEETHATALEMAVKMGRDVGIAQVLLAEGRATFHRPSGLRDGGSLLHRAVVDGAVDVVEYLLQQYADVDERDDADHTPLLLAVDRDDVNTEVIRVLLRNGAAPYAQSGVTLKTPLHVAAARGDATVLDLLCHEPPSMRGTDAPFLHLRRVLQEANGEPTGTAGRAGQSSAGGPSALRRLRERRARGSLTNTGSSAPQTASPSSSRNTTTARQRLANRTATNGDDGDNNDNGEAWMRRASDELPVNNAGNDGGDGESPFDDLAGQQQQRDLNLSPDHTQSARAGNANRAKKPPPPPLITTGYFGLTNAAARSVLHVLCSHADPARQAAVLPILEEIVSAVVSEFEASHGHRRRSSGGGGGGSSARSGLVFGGKNGDAHDGHRGSLGVRKGMSDAPVLLSLTDAEGRTALHEACRAHFPAAVRLLLSHNPSAVTCVDARGSTPLHDCVAAGSSSSLMHSAPANDFNPSQPAQPTVSTMYAIIDALVATVKQSVPCHVHGCCSSPTRSVLFVNGGGASAAPFLSSTITDHLRQLRAYGTRVGLRRAQLSSTAAPTAAADLPAAPARKETGDSYDVLRCVRDYCALTDGQGRTAMLLAGEVGCAEAARKLLQVVQSDSVQGC